MNWEVLLVLLIPMAVWILGTIFKSVEERMEKNQLQDQPINRQRPPTRPQSELDRFLEEARRRRARIERGKEDPDGTLVVPPPRPVAPVPLAPRPEERPKQPANVVSEARAQRREEKAAAAAVSAAPPSAEKLTFTLPTSMEAPIAPALPSPTMSTPVTPGDGAQRKESPMLTILTGMLRDRQSLAAAFILREILDRPLCMRRGEARSSRQG